MSQLDLLVNRFLDDRAALAPEEVDALIDGLRAEPARAVALREQLVVDDLLAQKLTVDRLNFLAQVEQRIADFERSEAELDDQVAELRELATREYASQDRARPARWAIQSPWARAGLALSLVAIVAGLWLAPQWVPERWLPPRRLGVAHVVTVQGPVIATEDESQSAVVGATRLFTGQRIETPADSSLTLEYDDQTQVRISGGTVVTLGAHRASGAKRLHVDRGELWADVARQAAGAMEFSTPHAVAVVLGTQLRLTVTTDDTLLEVTEGLVRLDRLDRADSIDVAASQSGLATDVALHLRQVTWPATTDGLVYALDPFVRRVPRIRQPGGGDRWYTSPLDSVGGAARNELDDTLDLSGGYFRSRDDGEDIVTASLASSEFSLELVYKPDVKPSAETRRLVSLEADDGTQNFGLSRVGDAWKFVLRTGAGAEPGAMAFQTAAASEASQPAHLAITFGNGKLVAYENGRPLEPSGELHGSLAAWTPATLVIGADNRGNHAWRGTIHALALYQRCLAADEVAQNVQNYRQLAARRR